MYCRRNSKKNACQIVIYGTGALVQNILTTGLQLNLYSPDQKIEHHVISQDTAFQIKHHDMPLMDWDKIHYYSENEKRIWKIISAADIVIAAETMPVERLRI